MKCPKCGKNAHAIDSRIRSDGSVRRRRRCVRCGYRYTTTEVIETEATTHSIPQTSYEYCFLNEEYSNQNCRECPYRRRCLTE